MFPAADNRKNLPSFEDVEDVFLGTPKSTSANRWFHPKIGGQSFSLPGRGRWFQLREVQAFTDGGGRPAFVPKT